MANNLCLLAQGVNGAGNPIVMVEVYPPSQKTTAVRPWMNAHDGPTVALAKVGASADSAEEMKDTTGLSPWRLHLGTSLLANAASKSSGNDLSR